nr:transposase [Desulfosporosinus acididurans]
MLKTKLHSKNYNELGGHYQVVLPFNFDVLILEDDSIRLLSHILEGLNYEALYQAYSSTGRKPVVESKILFKVLTYAYISNLYSSRKIEVACKRDINFMWLLEGCKAPDHSTIARFRKDCLKESIEDIFFQMVKYLHKLGEVELKNLFVDGTNRSEC